MDNNLFQVLGASPLIIATLSVAMITLISNRLHELSSWGRPVLSSTHVINMFGIERSLQFELTYRRMAYFSMLLYGSTHVFGLGCFFYLSEWKALDDVTVGLLLANAVFVLAWVLHHAAFTKEPQVQPKPLIV